MPDAWMSVGRVVHRSNHDTIYTRRKHLIIRRSRLVRAPCGNEAAFGDKADEGGEDEVLACLVLNPAESEPLPVDLLDFARHACRTSLCLVTSNSSTKFQRHRRKIQKNKSIEG